MTLLSSRSVLSAFRRAFKAISGTDEGLQVVPYGTPDGSNFYALDVAADGSLTVTVAGSGVAATALVDTGEEVGPIGTSRSLLVTNSGSSSTRVGAVNLTNLDVVIRETTGSTVISPRIPPRAVWEDDVDIGASNIDVATVTGTTTTGRVTGYIKH